jgi:light-regulated signal transduction histidine kinase (bacteriophytochrome)
MIEILEQGRSDRAAEIAVSGSDLAASKDETAASNSDLRTSEGRLSASNDNLSDFSYSVAHDFRAPLRSIHGFSRIIKEEYAPVLDAEALRLLGLIQGSAKDMDDLIGDLLDISRFGRMEPERSLVDMNALAKTEVEGGLGSAEVRDFEITIGQLPAAWADPAMIARVWKNLISNAVKFSGPSPRHRIRISGRREGAMEVYSIEDAGVGFEERYADKLFGNFHRLHPPKDFPGRGIGLAIVKRIIGRHGGAVGAEGRPGKGATFWFSLPERS